MTADDSALIRHGVAGALGLLVAGYATQSYLWLGYQRATPDVGSVVTSGGAEVVTALLFVGGVAVAYVSFARGLAFARETPDRPDDA